MESVVKAFTVGDERSFDQDPRFGLSVLSEIASRALSAALNDPGTAIDVIGRAVRVLSVWSGHAEDDGEAEVLYPRLRVRPVELDDLFDDIFTPIARDGAGVVEVHIRLQKALLILGRMEARVSGTMRCATRGWRWSGPRRRWRSSTTRQSCAACRSRSAS